jgi:glycosyltransferase involved in cell wall biosynthesis
VITQNNGTLIPTQNVDALADAMLAMLSTPNIGQAKALEAQKTIAQSFDVGVWFKHLLAIYGEVRLA